MYNDVEMEDEVVDKQDGGMFHCKPRDKIYSFVFFYFEVLHL